MQFNNIRTVIICTLLLISGQCIAQNKAKPQRMIVIMFDYSNTVFGDLDTETEVLPDNYRTHGSLHEKDIPLFIYNAHNLPAKEYFKYNMNLTSWLYTAHP